MMIQADLKIVRKFSISVSVFFTNQIIQSNVTAKNVDDICIQEVIVNDEKC